MKNDDLFIAFPATERFFKFPASERFFKKFLKKVLTNGFFMIEYT